MRRQTALGVVTGVALLSIAAAASASPTGGGDGSPASQAVAAQFGGTVLSLSPQGGYDSAVLRVSGPGGYSLEKRLGAGEAIAADLLAEGRMRVRGGAAGSPASGALKDGRYQYEVVLRSGAGRRVDSGVFFVQGGATVSRDSMRSQLAAVGSDLRSDRAALPGASRSGAPRSSAPGVQGPSPETTNVDDFLLVHDTAGDDITQIYMESDFYTYQPNWRIDNTYGNLQFNSYNLLYYYVPPYTTRQERVTITGYGGYLGVGTTAPTNRLHVYSYGGFNVRLNDGYSGASTVLDMYAGALNLNSSGGNYQVVFRNDAPTSSLVVDSTGIGVGTSAPGADFHLANQDGIGDTVFKLDNAGSWNLGTTGTGVFTFNKSGTGGQEATFRDRNDVSGATFEVQGSVKATNVVFPSSRALKTGFTALDPSLVLQQVASLPMTSWRFKTDPEGTVRYGPIAEDFHAAFDVGDGETVSALDLQGLSLTAIQGLDSKVDEALARKDAEIADLRRINAVLERRLAAIEARLAEGSP